MSGNNSQTTTSNQNTSYNSQQAQQQQQTMGTTGQTTNMGTTAGSTAGSSQAWAPALPELQNLITQISGNSTALTPEQQAALGTNWSAASTMPNMAPGVIGTVGNLQGSNNGVNQAGMWNNAYGMLMDRMAPWYSSMAPYMNADYTNPNTNPNFKAALDQVNNQITNNTKAYFDAAGRGGSAATNPTGGGAAGNAAEGDFLRYSIAGAEAPMLSSEFNTLSGLQQGALGAYMGGLGQAYGAGANTAQGTTGLLQTPLMNQIAGAQLAGSVPGLWMGPASAQIGAANLGYSTPWANISPQLQDILSLAGTGQQTAGQQLGAQQQIGTSAKQATGSASGTGTASGTSTSSGTSTTTQPVNALSTGLGAGLGLLSLFG